MKQQKKSDWMDVKTRFIERINMILLWKNQSWIDKLKIVCFLCVCVSLYGNKHRMWRKNTYHKSSVSIKKRPVEMMSFFFCSVTAFFLWEWVCVDIVNLINVTNIYILIFGIFCDSKLARNHIKWRANRLVISYQRIITMTDGSVFSPPSLFSYSSS